jgi:hypothetical protein
VFTPRITMRNLDGCDPDELEQLLRYAHEYLRANLKGFVCSDCRKDTGTSVVYDGERSFVCTSCDAANNL